MVKFEVCPAQPGYGPLRERFLMHCEGVLVLYDVCRRETFECVKGMVEDVVKIRRERGVYDPVKDMIGITNFRNGEGSERVEVVIVGNKIDKEGDRVVSRDEGRGMAKKLGFAWAECSLRRCEGVDEAMHEVVRRIRASRGKVLREVEELRKKQRRKQQEEEMGERRAAEELKKKEEK
jgi:GTPase KRas protein